MLSSKFFGFASTISHPIGRPALDLTNLDCVGSSEKRRVLLLSFLAVRALLASSPSLSSSSSSSLLPVTSQSNICPPTPSSGLPTTALRTSFQPHRSQGFPHP